MDIIKKKLITLKRIIRAGLMLISYYPSLRRSLKNYYNIRKLRPFRFFTWHHGCNYYLGNLGEHTKFIKLSNDKFIIRNEYEALIELQKSISINNMYHFPRNVEFREMNRFDYLIQDFIEGYSLTEFKKDLVQSYSVQEQIKLIKSFEIILEELHKSKLVHRDVRPANIIIEKSSENGIGNVVLIDFAFALKNTEGNLKLFLTKQNEINVLKELGEGYSPRSLYWDDAYSFLLIIQEITTNEEWLSEFKEKVGLMTIEARMKGS
ncbi:MULTISPECIES: protein kinase domain-containing protein [Shouchella]|uniref:protein kinase domain-containing protein n=1 Tax=Shouchella TaxID=2893057 RepID=UPI000BA60FF4|nr:MULTISPECIES: AarF/UbiB family protein [Shouchella]MCM3378792.1 AarF/UbiB family protein [Shouchella rhizosphaerae]PAD17293.1 hypothetical protein CHH73_09860 [Shouchella clausii]